MAITAEITLNNSKNINAGIKQMLIKQTFGIPIALVTGIADNLNNPEKWKQRPSLQSSNVTLTTSQAVNVLADSMRKPSLIAFRIYVALLQAMDKLLSSPSINASKNNIQLNKSVTLNIETDVGRLLKRINLAGSWSGLKPLTMKDKLRIGSRTFWHHTGESEQAFHVAVRERLASLTPKSFVKDIKAPVTSDIRNGRVSFAKFSYKLGVPSFSGNSPMNEIITKPFETGQITPISNLPRGQHLRGTDRILAAEHTRPMLRQLSAKAGCELQSQLTGQQPKSVLMQRITKIMLKKEKAVPDVQDLPNIKMLWVNRHK
jgi:hypothetical protein